MRATLGRSFAIVVTVGLLLAPAAVYGQSLAESLLSRGYMELPSSTRNTLIVDAVFFSMDNHPPMVIYTEHGEEGSMWGYFFSKEFPQKTNMSVVVQVPQADGRTRQFLKVWNESIVPAIPKRIAALPWISPDGSNDRTDILVWN